MEMRVVIGLINVKLKDIHMDLRQIMKKRILIN